MSDYDIEVLAGDFPRIEIITQHVVAEGGGGGSQQIEVNINGDSYPVISIDQVTLSGVQGWKYTLDDGSLDGIAVFFADQTGLNTVKTAIEAQIPTVDSTLSSTSTNPVQNKMITNALANKQEVTDAVTVSAVSTTGVRISDGSSGMQYVVPLTSAIKSTITASDTNPVNSVAVIAYINSLDATNTLY